MFYIFFLHISWILFCEILSNFLSMWRIIWKKIENKRCVISITIYITKFSVYFAFSVVCFFRTLNKSCCMRISKNKLSWLLKTFVNFHIFDVQFFSSFCTFVDVPIRTSVYTGQCLSSTGKSERRYFNENCFKSEHCG